jgi:hypothetical protein
LLLEPLAVFSEELRDDSSLGAILKNGAEQYAFTSIFCAVTACNVRSAVEMS